MKKLFSFTLNVIIGLMAALVIIVLLAINSTKSVEWLANTYAPQYGFGYQKITGGILSGLHIQGVTFEDNPLVENLELQWNIASLLYSRIAINSLVIDALDTTTLQKVIEAFASDSNSTKEESSASALPVTIGVSKFKITLKPFDHSGIAIKKVALESQNILINNSGVDIGQLDFQSDTNLTSLSISAKLSNRVVALDKLTINNLQLFALMQAIEGMTSQEKTGAQNNGESTQNSQSIDNPFVPQKVTITALTIDILPQSYQNIDINNTHLASENIVIDMDKIMHNKPQAIAVQKLIIDANSSIASLVLTASLEHERVTLSNIQLHQIDINSIIGFAQTQEENKTVSENKIATDTNNTEVSSGIPNPFIPKVVALTQLNATLKKSDIASVMIENFEFNASDIEFHPIELLATKGVLQLKATTNLATFAQQATIKNNKIISQALLVPLEQLYTTYKLPINPNALKSIPITINANDQEVNATLDLDAKNILVAKEGEFNIQSLILKNSAHYNITTSKLNVISDGNISTPYTKHITLANTLAYQENALTYQGQIIPHSIEGVDANLTKPIENLQLQYSGDMQNIEANLTSEQIEGHFVSNGFKKAKFTLSTITPLKIIKLTTLPKELEQTQVDFNLSMPLNLNNILPLQAKLDIRSNIANIHTKVDFNQSVLAQIITSIPPHSLLQNYGKELNLKALKEIKTLVALKENKLDTTINSQLLNASMFLNMDTNQTKARVDIAKSQFELDGFLHKDLLLHYQTGTIGALLKDIQKLYRFDAPTIDGDLNLALQVSRLKELSLDLNSKKITLESSKESRQEFDNTALKLHFFDDNLTLEKYDTTFQKQRIFATKPSKITLDHEIVSINPLWLNDELETIGTYNLKSKKGELQSTAKSFHITHELITLATAIDIQTTRDQNDTDISGILTLQGGDLHIDLDQKTFASDNDIIILQNHKDKEPNSFMDNLSTAIKVNSQKPLRYKSKDADIKIDTDLLVQKSKGGPLYLLGTAKINKNSFYMFENKKFTFQKSIIAFTGDASKPILDIKVGYKSINYDITIHITGDPQTPNINFSSRPSLSREQILSVILFDSVDAGNGSSSEDMMKMMGGALAKSALSNIGIQIDHLTLGTDGNFEIGKKISNDVTLIYINGTKPTSVLQYDYSRSIKARISTDGTTSGADIIYKRAF